MAISAIGGYAGISYDPYIYNSRQVNSASLNAIKPISDDATDGGVDFSNVNSAQENVNPLRPGETSDFAGILMSQMATSSLRQYQLFGDQMQTAAATEAEAQAPLVADVFAS